MIESATIQEKLMRDRSGEVAEKLTGWFITSVAVILLITGLAKLISAFGTSEILTLPDPILRLSFRNLMLAGGTFELFVSAFCFFKREQRILSLSLMAWTATAFSVYRAAGVPASRTAYAELTLTVPGKYDKELVGLYTIIEQVDKTFLKAHFRNAKGLLPKQRSRRRQQLQSPRPAIIG